jgi:nitronate monooxygenase
MWSDTQITKRLGVAYPIIQAPFGDGLSSVALAAAVSNAGCLGSYGAHMLTPAEIKADAAAIRTRTGKPFALHLWVNHNQKAAPSLDRERFERMRSRLVPYYRELGIAAPVFPKQIGRITRRRSRPCSLSDRASSASPSAFLRPTSSRRAACTAS